MNAAELFGHWKVVRRDLLRALDLLADEQLAFVPREGLWSLGKVARHIAEAFRRQSGFRRRFGVDAVGHGNAVVAQQGLGLILVQVQDRALVVCVVRNISVVCVVRLTPASRPGRPRPPPRLAQTCPRIDPVAATGTPGSADRFRQIGFGDRIVRIRNKIGSTAILFVAYHIPEPFWAARLKASANGFAGRKLRRRPG